MIRLIHIICVVLLMNISVVMADNLDVAKINQPSISLTTHLGILEDTDKLLTIEDIQNGGFKFKTDFPVSKSINFSYTKSVVWLSLNIENSSDKQIEKILEIDHPLLKYVDFYFESSHNSYQIHTGYGRPYQNRAYKSRIFAFPLQLQAHSHNVIYIRIASPNVIDIPARLWALEEFQQKERGAYAFQALYFGILITVLIFSMTLALFLKEKIYFIYVNMVVFVALALIAFRGLGAEFIWQDYPILTQIGTVSFGGITAAFQLLFLRNIFKKTRLTSTLNNIINFLIFCETTIPFLVTWDMGYAKYCSLIIFISIAFSLYLSMLGVVKKERSSYFLCAGFSILFISGIFNLLYTSALISTNFLTANSFSIGSALEMLIFLLLLTERYQFMQIDKLQVDKNLSETNSKLMAEIEERKKGEQRQAELTQRLNHMQKLESIGRLTSGVAHDFNNLLMAISGHNELIKYSAEDILLESTCRKQLNAEIVESSSQIRIACGKAASLIEKMLLYCRRDGDHEIVNNPIVDLNAVLEENVKMLRSSIPNTINFQLALTKQNFDLSYVDETNLNQIIVNLFINARDAMKGKGTITLKTQVINGIENKCSCCQSSLEGQFVEISVGDTGSGIEPEIAKRIFEPFYTTKPVGEGTGLGLSVMSGILHNLGGHVLLESEVGVGTTFRLFFPLVDAV